MTEDLSCCVVFVITWFQDDNTPSLSGWEEVLIVICLPLRLAEGADFVAKDYPLRFTVLQNSLLSGVMILIMLVNAGGGQLT